MNAATQTDLDWLEKALEQLELMGQLANDSVDQRSGSTTVSVAVLSEVRRHSDACKPKKV